MAGNELDDVLSSLLGELDDLTLSLENDISSKSTGHPPPPPPPSMSAKPTFSAQLSFPPPPPPPAATQTNSSFLPPPPPPQAMKPVASAVDDSTFIPPPPPLEITTAAQDQEDLSAMLDDLASFTEDLKENKPATKNKLNLPPMEDSHQFGTLRRTGGSYLQPDFSDGTFEDNNDMTNALESLAKDIEISKEEEHMPTEAELANLSPVVNELEALAASLGQGTAHQEPPALPSPALKPTIPPKLASMPLPPPPPPKPEKSCFRKKPRAASNDHINQLEHHHHHHEGGSLSTASSSRSSLRSSSIITTDSSTVSSSSATASSHDLHHTELPDKPRTVTFNLQPVVTEEATAAADSVSVPSVDSGVDTLDCLSPEEREERLKSEKMKIALEKLKEARIQKLVVKVYNEDQSSKTLMIDERMTTRFVVNQLLEKNHFDFSQDWTIMEEIPSLFMERMFEEHEKPCDFLSYWTRDSTNQLRLLERKDKYALFKTPQRYLLPPSAAQDRMPERQKQSLIEEFFSGGGPTTQVPELQGWLHVKGDGNKSWSRKYCVLRSSGLYVNKTGEPKKGKKLSDLSCMVMFEQIQLYHGRGWKKKFKSPFDYGFALKHPSIQVKSKQIRYLCCEDFATYMSWTVGIRLAKNGKQLLDNYNKTQEDLKSTSVVTSHLAMRQQQQQADSQSRNSASSEGSGDKSSVRSTSTSANSSKPVGVKSIFEGAWQRAAEEEGDAAESFGTLGRMSMRRKTLQQRATIKKQ